MPPEAVGVGLPLAFGDGVEGLEIEGLQRPIQHRGNLERSVFAVALGDVDPTQRLRSITACLQSVYGGALLGRVRSGLLVHSRRAPPLVLGPSRHRENLRAVRVGEQVLQSFHLVPPARGGGLYDTRLEPTHRGFCLLKLGFTEGSALVRGGTSLLNRPLLCSVSPLIKLSRNPGPAGSPPAFAGRDVAEGRTEPGATPIRPISGRPSPLPASATRSTLRRSLWFAYPALGGPRSEEVCAAYRVLETEERIGLGAPCPPAAFVAHGRGLGSPDARCGAIVAPACQHVWPVVPDDVYQEFASARHALHPRPSLPCAGSYVRASRSGRPEMGGIRCPRPLHGPLPRRSAS